MNLHRTTFYLLLILLLASCAEKPGWPEVTQESKPWTRWWWMGNAVDQENLSRELKEMAAVGIGGVEITPIYGVKGEEARFIEYLTPGFSEILNFTIDEASKNGMAVDLPPGSGWRCGGPFVPEEKGLWSLRMEKFDVKKGQVWKLPEGLNHVAAASFVNKNKKATIIQANEEFQVPENGKIYLATRVKNGDKVKRASEGGTGWAIDTFNDEITNWYLDEFWNRLGIEEGKLRCFFHDSFEYTGDFTTKFTDEFKTRRGYDLAEYLFVLAGDCEDEETTARVKSDYRETLSDLVLESFIQPMTDWANRHKSLNRNQAHGSPGNILDLYAACDIPETEIFRTVQPGEVDVFVNKFASSAAHVTGKKLVSSESFTWLEEHWTVTTSDMVRATNRFFLAGINHMFFHGTCYSPKEAEWPGWLFYASTQVNNRNPLWRELPALFSYIQRTQSVLQSSVQQNDVLVYWPYYDVAASGGRLFSHLGVNKDAGWFKEHPISGLSENLAKAGFCLDYISDRQLIDCQAENGKVVTSGKATYKAVVVPVTKYIPVETMKKLAELSASGVVVVFDSSLPKSVPGMAHLAERNAALSAEKIKIDTLKQVGVVTQLLQENGLEGENSLAENGFYFLKMKQGEESVYLVINTGTEPKDEWVELKSPAKNYIFMHPMSGKISKAQSRENTVRIQLEPEEAIFIKCQDTEVKLPGFVYENKMAERKRIETPWTIEFISGGPVLPGAIQTEKTMAWTAGSDAETQRFAGTARYKTEFIFEGKSKTGVIDLGEVKDCAHVFLNGKDYGTLSGPTFKVKVANLKKGKNVLEVEVTNVAANRIRDLDIRGISWRNFYDINLVNIDYKPFDASGWEVKPAGLMGPVSIGETE